MNKEIDVTNCLSTTCRRSLLVMVFAAMFSAGCGAKTEVEPSSAATPAVVAAEDSEPSKPAPLTLEQVEFQRKMQVIIDRTLAKLDPEDQKLAQAQRICPVMEKPLGTMGKPIKVDVQGRPVFICCEGCREELLAEPEKSLAKLPK